MAAAADPRNRTANQRIAAKKTTPSGTKPPDMPDPASGPLTLPSTAHLLDLAGQREWNLAKPSTSIRLGDSRSRATPADRWPGMHPQRNRFARAFEREKVEIVDRWLAADGSQRVVMTAPSGATCCGRAEAWSALDPLFEPIMMWRPCGGGGKHTFDWPDLYQGTATGGGSP